MRIDLNETGQEFKQIENICFSFDIKILQLDFTNRKIGVMNKVGTRGGLGGYSPLVGAC